MGVGSGWGVGGERVTGAQVGRGVEWRSGEVMSRGEGERVSERSSGEVIKSEPLVTESLLVILSMLLPKFTTICPGRYGTWTHSPFPFNTCSASTSSVLSSVNIS